MTADKLLLNCFEVFGLKQSYFIDEEHLNSSYLEQQSKNHPDRFINAESIQRAESLNKTAEINYAYSVLNSDEDRAKHLLELSGIKVSDEGELSISPEVLEEAFDLRTRLSSVSSVDDVDVIYNEATKALDDDKKEFGMRYENGEFENASDLYNKIIYKKKLLREVNSKYKEFQK